MVAFANPVVGRIAVRGTSVPIGQFVVTSTFAEHVASGRGAGIDIGDGRCGDPILAMASGTVSLAGLVGDAKVVRVRHPQYPGYETGYAHLASIEVSLGQVVSASQRLGTLGMTGATACHLHGGCKVNGVETDWWPLLIQNGATDGGDMIPIPGANYKRLANKKTTLTVPGNFRNERKSGTVLKQFPAGTAFYPVAYANDGDVPTGSQSGEWFYGILYDDAPAGYIGGWFHSSLVGPLVDDVAVAVDPAKEAAARAAGISDAAKAAAAVK